MGKSTHLRRAEPSSDGDQRSSQDALDSGGRHEVLQVGRESEVDRIVVAEQAGALPVRLEVREG